MKTNKTRFVDKKSVASRINQLRCKKGLTQAELAKMLGVTRQNVSAWEKGLTFPNIHCITFMSKYYGVPVDYILGVSNHRYNIKVPEHLEFDLTKLNNEGIQMLYNHYKLLINSDEYKNK